MSPSLYLNLSEMAFHIIIPSCKNFQEWILMISTGSSHADWSGPGWLVANDLRRK